MKVREKPVANKAYNGHVQQKLIIAVYANRSKD